MRRTVVEAKPKTMTLEEWADLDEDIGGELIDGVLQEEEMPSFLHGIIVTWLIAALHGWAERKGGQVAGSEAKIAVAPRRGRKPDLSVYLREQPAAEDTLIRVTPHLVVEVASPRPRDARRDRVEKLGAEMISPNELKPTGMRFRKRFRRGISWLCSWRLGVFAREFIFGSRLVFRLRSAFSACCFA